MAKRPPIRRVPARAVKRAVARAVPGAPFDRGFTLASLWAAGQAGAWYDRSDLSTLSQDTAGATPVTANGQTVGRNLDKSGRGNHATQATAGARPTLDALGLRFDGSADFLPAAAGGGGTTGFFYSTVLTPAVVGVAQVLWSDRGTNSGYRIRLTSGNQVELSAGNGSAYTAIGSGTNVVALNTPVVITAWDDGTTLNVQLNQGEVRSVARPAVAAGTAGFTEGRDNGAGTGYLNGYLRDLVYRKNGGVTAAQRSGVQHALAAKAGITL